MTAKEVFVQSCKNFADWGISPELLKQQSQWLPDSMDELKKLLESDLSKYCGKLGYTEEMIDYLHTSASAKDLWLPLLYILTDNRISSIKMCRLVAVLFYCAKEGCDVFRHSSTSKDLSSVQERLWSTTSKDSLYYEANLILSQGLLQNGTPVTGSYVQSIASDNFAKTLTLFEDWLQSVGNPSCKSIAGSHESVFTFASDITTYARGYSGPLPGYTEMMHRCNGARFASTLKSILLYIATDKSVRPDRLMYLIVRFLKLYVEETSCVIAHSSEITTVEQLR